MEHIIHTYEKTCLVSKEDIQAGWEKLAPEIGRVKQAVDRGGYGSVYASVNLPDDQIMREEVKKIAQSKKALKPAMVIVVGIGGSSLGLEAVHQALYGTLYNDQKPNITFYVADTIDTDYLQDIMLLAEQELEEGNTVIVTVISKSGSTTETVVNAHLFIHMLYKAYPDTYVDYVVIISDEGSALWNYAGEHHMSRLAIPKNVGGRYSVFSAVGLFPLALLGVDIDMLCRGARDMRDQCITGDEDSDKVNRERGVGRVSSDVDGNSVNVDKGESRPDARLNSNIAAVRAVLLAEQYRRGIAIHDMFLFSVDLAKVGAWYRQLMGESIGKVRLEGGKQVPVGIMPTVSMGTVDLHAVAQLYLGGPHVRFTTFVAVNKNNVGMVVPGLPEKDGARDEVTRDQDLCVSTNVQGKSVVAIMDAITQGVQKAYCADKRPFVVLTIPEKNAYYIGMLMQLHMLEMIYVGFLLGVDPFDQPHVELYKQETRRLLDAL